MFSAASIADTPPLPHPKDLVGEWVVFDSTRVCGVRFWIDAILQANGYRMTIDPLGGACTIPLDAVAWRPAPDGISMLDHEGTTLIFFSREDGGYRSDIFTNDGLRLRRK